YLNFVLYQMAQPYRGVESIVAAWAQEAGETAVLDLGSGGGGHVDWLLRRAESSGLALPRFILSDLFPGPNIPTYQAIQTKHGNHRVGYISNSVDACAPPAGCCRLRSMFSLFHHLTPEQARRMLASACSEADGILIAEGVCRAVLLALLMVALLPVY